MRFEGLQSLIWEWAKKKGLSEPSDKQVIKIGEEFGEVCSAYLKKDISRFKDGIGDLLVTIIIMTEQNGEDVVECLELAYNEIKDRKGKLVDGSFIKEADIKKEEYPYLPNGTKVRIKSKKEIEELDIYDGYNISIDGKCLFSTEMFDYCDTVQEVSSYLSYANSYSLLNGGSFSWHPDFFHVID